MRALAPGCRCRIAAGRGTGADTDVAALPITRARDLAVGPLDLLAQALDILLAMPLGYFSSSATMASIVQCRRSSCATHCETGRSGRRGTSPWRMISSRSAGSVASSLHWRSGSWATLGCRCGRRERGQQLVRIPQPAGVLEDPGRLHRGAAAGPLCRRREVRRAGHAVALRDDAGVLVGAGARANGVADQLGLRGRDGAG